VIFLQTAKSFFKENRVFYYITLITWLASAVCGIICAVRLEGTPFEDISAYVKQTLSTEMSAGAFIKLGTGENVRFLIMLLVCSSAPVFLPATLFLSAFKGFSAGFTSAVIIKIYSLKGALVCLGTVVLPCTFSMPVIFIMIVSALRFSVRKTEKHSPRYGNDRSKEWFSYILLQLILTFLLSVITVAESFLSKLIIGLMNP